MNDLHYALIRFIPDIDRMEPVNFGVVLQGGGKIDFMLNPHFARRKGVQTPVFQRWRDFLTEEIRGEPMPLFQPRKDSVEFLSHLSSLCEQTVSISKPLFVAAHSSESFEQILESLFTQLVLPEDATRPERTPRPTTRFREIEDEKQFRKRGLNRHPYVMLPGEKRWNAYRQLLNGENIVIDKVEVGNAVGLTADEIQKLSSGVETFLDRFLLQSQGAMATKYYLIADSLNEKFTDQTDDNFQAMKDEYEHVVQTVRTRSNCVVLQHPDEVADFANCVDQKLPAATKF